MSTLRTEKKQMQKRLFWYLCITVLTALFGMIYEHFSHEVYSPWMMFAFLIPLCGCLVLFVLPYLLHRKQNWISIQCFHSSIATFTAGSLLQGVLEIYGTTNHLMIFYWITGSVLLAAGILVNLIAYLLQTARS